MEIADVRKRVRDTIERAKRRRAQDRRTRVDEARQAFDVFLEQTATPLLRQIANVLRADGYLFTLHTPADSVRLASDRHPEDYVEIRLDTSGETPRVVGHVTHTRASGVVESERAFGDPATLTEEDLLAFVLSEIEPLVR
jgi:hypothetical protein